MRYIIYLITNSFTCVNHASERYGKTDEDRDFCSIFVAEELHAIRHKRRMRSAHANAMT